MAIIEVAIGLSFLYAVLSLVCTAATEGLGNLFALRARMLRLALANLFGEPKTGKNTRNLLDHPLVSGLWQNRTFRGFIPGLPDYIPANIYVAALLETVETSDGLNNRTRPGSLADLSGLIGKIKNEPIRRALQSLIAGTPDLETALQRVEQYYDAAMESVRGWYARWAQLITFPVAVGIGASVNADTLMVTDTLWRDSALRADIVRLAQEEANRRATSDTVSRPTPTKPDNPGDQGSSGSDKVREKKEGGTDSFGHAAEQLAAFPLGWTTKEKDPRAFPATAGEVCRKVIGLLVTVLAVSLGAPFWFDLINRFATLRSSGAPPENKRKTTPRTTKRRSRMPCLMVRRIQSALEVLSDARQPHLVSMRLNARLFQAKPDYLGLSRAPELAELARDKQKQWRHSAMRMPVYAMSGSPRPPRPTSD